MGEIWPKEDIPNQDSLFMRAHKSYFKDGELVAGVFSDKGEGGMSTNWNKYCQTAEDARQKAKKPAENGVIVTLVGKIRAIHPLTVEHTPISEDRSHTSVVGKKDTEVRLALLRAFELAMGLQGSR